MTSQSAFDELRGVVEEDVRRLHVPGGFYTEDRLVGLDEPFTELRSEVIRDDTGAVKWLRYGSRLHKREPQHTAMSYTPL